MLRAPIPGMSLTTEPGNRPWENPPQLVTVDEAIEFYAEKLLDPEKADVILEAMELEVSIESMADMLTTSAVMEGIHTIDVSILVMPVIKEMIRYVGDLNEVEYLESYAELDKQKRIPKNEARKIVREVAKNYNRLPSSKEEPEEDMEVPEPKAGLMARRIMSEEK
jgi:hypothetical protein